MSDIKATTEAPSTATPTVEPTVEATPETKQEVVEPTPVDKTEEPSQTDAPETSAAAENAETSTEPPKEIEPISEGVLETKFLSVIPIFLKKHTFYFSEEAIPEENLGEYLKKEKTKVGHATYAHATQTGKGLLFYTKTDKTKPSGIVRLDGAEIKTQGDKKFTIKSAGNELQLEASTAAIRERWVHTLKIKIAESEGVHAATCETEGFKAALEKLKPAPVVAAKKEEPVEAKKEGEEAKEETPADATTAPAVEEEVVESPVVKPEEEKKDEKKRSSSRNRLNRFSFFGKKEEKKDEVKEEQPVAEVKEEPAPAPETAPETAVVAPQETAPTSEEVAPVVPQAEATPTEEPRAETSPVTSPKSNRKSFLGNFFAKKKEEKKDSPAVEEEGEAKSPEPVTATATETEAAPTAQEPLPDVTEQPAAVETQEPVKSDTEAESPRERKPSGGIFGSLRRDKSTDGEDKPRRSLSFWKKDKEKKGKEEAQPTAITESEPQAEATTEEPVKTEPSSAAPVIPDVTATEGEKKITDLPTAPAVTVGDGSKA